MNVRKKSITHYLNVPLYKTIFHDAPPGDEAVLCIAVVNASKKSISPSFSAPPPELKLNFLHRGGEL